MRQTLDRRSWLLAGSVALPMLAAGIYVNWFGPAGWSRDWVGCCPRWRQRPSPVRCSASIVGYVCGEK